MMSCSAERCCMPSNAMSTHARHHFCNSTVRHSPYGLPGYSFRGLALGLLGTSCLQADRAGDRSLGDSRAGKAARADVHPGASSTGTFRSVRFWSPSFVLGESRGTGERYRCGSKPQIYHPACKDFCRIRQRLPNWSLRRFLSSPHRFVYALLDRSMASSSHALGSAGLLHFRVSALRRLVTFVAALFCSNLVASHRNTRV